MSRFKKRLIKIQGEPQARDKEQKKPIQDKKGSFFEALALNTERFEELFQYPANDALKFREMHIPSINRKAMVLFVAGAANTDQINGHVIKPLLESSLNMNLGNNLINEIKNNILTIASGKKIATFDEAVKLLLNGNTVILVDGEKEAIVVDTTGFEKRSVSEPTSEIVLRGPKSAFVEAADVNRSLIRRQLKDHRLVSETVTVGRQSPQEVSILYLDNIVDKALVKNIKDRLAQVDRDAVLTLSTLEELIEERPYSLFPSTMTTERPDRASSFLLEGHVVLLMDNSPDALIAPITFWSLFHTAEDQFLRWAYGNFARIIRLIALFLALLMPAIYLAITTFHPEMLPTDLLLAIAGTRERVPFPTLWEMLLMEVTFEILREAGIRVPNPLGTTIGIVGALILGQAAVQANLISPLLVVVIAITGLSSFAIPDVGLSVMLRILRFGFLMAAHFLGFVGIALGFAALLAYATSIKSFGVPFFAPLSPHEPSSHDLFLRPILRRQWLRPLSMKPQEKLRAKSRGGNRS
ncbi:spore germination protein [Pseudobacillus sp. FSL P4-0506]|uniref:spore germination protein n=1 Tax=unclassified Pseudobacillus TaxID=2619284 RepID=UPI0030F6EC9F